MTPEIYHCVGDFAGDSLQLAKEAAKSDADIIVQAGVALHGGNVKNSRARKDRADPGYDRQAAPSPRRSPAPMCVSLKQKYPGVPVVTYVNTTADVESRNRYLLHVVKRCRSRRTCGGGIRHVYSNPDPRPVSREKRRGHDGH